MPGARLALGVQLQKLGRHVAHGLLDALLGLLPGPAAQLVDDGARAFRARVFLHAVKGLHRDLELVAPQVGEDHELAPQSPDLEGLQSLEAADPVVLVDHEVADLQVAEVGKEGARTAAAPPVEMNLLRVEVAVGQDGERGVGELEAGTEDADAEVDGRPLTHGQPVLAQDVAQTLGPAGGAEEQDRRALLPREVRRQRAQVARVAPHRTAGQMRAAEIEVHLAHVERGPGARPGREILGRDQRLRRLEGQRVRATLAFLARAGVEGVGLRGHHLRLEDDRRPRVEDGPRGDGGAGDEGQQVGEIVDHQRAAIDLLQERGQIAMSGKTLRERAPQRGQHGARGKDVRQGQDLEGGQRGRRALGLGVEAAQGLHGVAEELDADGRVAIGREDVQDPAAPGDLAGGGDGILAAVAAFIEHLEQDLRRHLFTRGDRDHARLEQPRLQHRPQQPRGRRHPGPELSVPGGVHGRGAPEGGIGMAGQAAEGRGPGGREGQDGAGRPDLLRQRPQIVGRLLDVVLARHHHQQRAPREQEGDEQARRPGEAVDLGHFARVERTPQVVQAGIGGEAREPRRGRGGGAHRFWIRSTMAVVDRPGTTSTRTTRPPAPSTSVRPTITSNAQSAPFTRTSGSSAAMISRGVSSS